jgi:hypothetical protein
VQDLTISLREENADLRSARVTYVCTVQNVGTTTVHLRGLEIWRQEGLTVLLNRSPEYERVQLLCRDVNQLLVRHAARRSRMRGMYPLGRAAIVVTEDDARLARERFFPDSDTDDSPLRRLVELKVDQIALATRRSAADDEARALVTLAPDQSYSAIYVLEFARGRCDARKYSVTVEARYDTEDRPDATRAMVASQAKVVSPIPWVLTVVAMLGGCLGVALRTAAPLLGTWSGGGAGPARATTSGRPATTWGEYLDAVLTPPHLAVAAGLALVVFNVFEFTPLADRVRFGITWRGAVVIGVLCGLAQPRLLDALGGLLGP